jgi:hypothetical protein
MTRGRTILSGVAGAILFAAAIGLASISNFAHGWLAAFVFLSMIPIGSLGLLLVHGISGGRWGGDLVPVLAPVARSMPLFLLAFLPVLIWRGAIYDWPSHGVPVDVARYYLNPPFFAARTIIAFVIWSLMAWRNVWKTPLGAGLGLVAHGILLTFVPADWILTLRPGSSSAGVGLGFGIEQMFAALAFAALWPQRVATPRANRDLAGLMLTCLLATVYFDYMQFIIIWYGNIPEKVSWFVARAYGVWPLIAFASFALGAAIPFLAILHPGVRANAGPLRVLGVLVLTGIALHVAWLTLPAFGYLCAIPAILSLLAILSIAQAAQPWFQAGRLRHG